MRRGGEANRGNAQPRHLAVQRPATAATLSHPLPSGPDAGDCQPFRHAPALSSTLLLTLLMTDWGLVFLPAGRQQGPHHCVDVHFT